MQILAAGCWHSDSSIYSCIACHLLSSWIKAIKEAFAHFRGRWSHFSIAFGEMSIEITHQEVLFVFVLFCFENFNGKKRKENL